MQHLPEGTSQNARGQSKTRETGEKGKKKKKQAGWMEEDERPDTESVTEGDVTHPPVESDE